MKFRLVPTALVALLALVLGLLMVPAPGSAEGGPDSLHCKPIDSRITVPNNFALHACFDGTFLLVINRTDYPVYVRTSGDARLESKNRTDGVVPWASLALDSADRELVFPGYEAKIRVGTGSGKVRLESPGDSIERRYSLANFVAGFAPGITAWPEIGTQFIRELDGILVRLHECLGDSPGFWKQTGCKVGYLKDYGFAVGRIGAGLALSLVNIKQASKLLLAITESLYSGVVNGTFVAAGAVKSLLDNDSEVRTLTIPAVPGSVQPADPGPDDLVVDKNPGPGTNYNPQNPTNGVPNGPIESTGPVRPTGPVRLDITGTCTTAGGKLTGASSGFTAGQAFKVRAWYPDGREYPGLITRGTVRSNGSITWFWDCTNDPAGTYTTEAVDVATGRSTGRVNFTIGAAPDSGTPGGGGNTTGGTGDPAGGTTGDPGGGTTTPTMGFTIEDSFYGGTWARNDTSDGTWHKQGNKPANGAFWYPNGLGVAVDCAQQGATYVVKFLDGRQQTWSTWLHVTDGKFYPSAATKELFTDGTPPGLRSC